ncbi:MAG: radical SAM protein, partial [Synechococcus sp. MED-G67]
LPQQSFEAWDWELSQALAQAPPHLSIYDLIVEPGTVFAWRQGRGELLLPDDDQAADRLQHTHQRLQAAGYGHYEVSSWALPGQASRHNRVYWSGASWWALGLGATSGVGTERLARPRTRDAYSEWVQSHAGRQGDGPAAGWPPVEDLLLVGLRRREGVDLAWLQQTGLWWLERAWLERVLAGWIERGVVELSAQRLRLVAPEGFSLSNAVLSDLLAALERSEPLAPTGARLG